MDPKLKLIQDECSADRLIIGIDECGWGSLAGPLVVTAFAFTSDNLRDYVSRDSKAYSPKQRKKIAAMLDEHPEVHYTHCLMNAYLFENTPPKELWERAVVQVAVTMKLRFPEALVVIDGNQIPKQLKTHKDVMCLCKADTHVPEVSAASVLGKVMHDEFMSLLHEEHPSYNFVKNQGYATAEHKEALARLGPCSEHRMNIQCVREALKLQCA